MFKTGIYDIQQIKTGSTLKSLLGDEKRISITLYDQIASELNADELSERLLSTFIDERGAYKRTHANRFDAFDKAVLKIIGELFSSRDALSIHDAAVSDARTSCDFFEKLEAKFNIASFIASDYSPEVLIVEDHQTKVTLSPSGQILEVVWPPFVFAANKNDSFWRYPLNRLARFYAMRFVVPSLMKTYKSGKIKTRSLFLFSPKATSIALKDPRFQLQQHNLLNPFEKTSDVIRAMNVLNPSRFSLEEFSRVILNLYNGLTEHGILITGSNPFAGDPVDGGVFKKTPNGFECIWVSNSGSPIEQQLTGFTPSTAIR